MKYQTFIAVSKAAMNDGQLNVLPENLVVPEL